MNVARCLLKEPSITAEQIVGFGYTLYAISRFPVTTPGISVEFGVVINSETKTKINGKPKTLNDMEYINFHISDNEFEISRGGSKDCGMVPDSYSLPH